jgi:hypothetical protein
MKTRLFFLAILSISLSAHGKPGDALFRSLPPAPADTSCRDTSVCVISDPFNLNTLCNPSGGVYYGSLAILGDQFNPAGAKIGANIIRHGVVIGPDTILLCTFTITVSDTVSPAGMINGAGNVCRGDTKEYTVSPIANATSYLWSFSGAAIVDSITNNPSVTLLFDNTFTSGFLTVRGKNDLCSLPGTISAGFSINVFAQPATTIRNADDTIAFTDSICMNSRIHYFAGPEHKSYKWSVVNGKIAGDSLARNVTIDWGKTTGHGTLTLSVEDYSGCSGTATRNVTIRNGLAPDPSTIWLFGYNMLVCSDSTVYSYHWYLDNMLIQGATNRYFLADTSNRKNYSVQTCMDNCCNMSAPYCFHKPAAIGDLTNGNILVFPNPASGKIQVRITGTNGHEGRLGIYSQYGLHIKEMAVPNNDLQIDVSFLPRGVYYLRYHNGSEGVYTSKIVKL